MARFCFYCGRELADRESCNCRVQTHKSGPINDSKAAYGTDNNRSGTNASENQDNAQSEDRAGQNQSNYRAGSGTTAGKQGGHARDRGQASAGYGNDRKDKKHTRRKSWKRQHQDNGRNFYPGFGAGSQADWRGRAQTAGAKAIPFMLRMRGMFGWIKAPADKIKAEALASKHKTSWIVLGISLLLFTLWTALFMMRSAIFYLGLALNIGNIYLYASIFSICFWALENLFVWLTIKLLVKLNISYYETLQPARTAFVYLSLFTIVALSGISTTPLFSLALMAGGVFFAIYVHIRSLCHIYPINGNQQLLIMVIVIMLLAAIFTFVGRTPLISSAPKIPPLGAKDTV